MTFRRVCCFFTGPWTSHPVFPSHVASGRCVLSAAAAGALAGVVSAFAEPSSWRIEDVLLSPPPPVRRRAGHRWQAHVRTTKASSGGTGGALRLRSEPHHQRTQCHASLSCTAQARQVLWLRPRGPATPTAVVPRAPRSTAHDTAPHPPIIWLPMTDQPPPPPAKGHDVSEDAPVHTEACRWTLRIVFRTSDGFISSPPPPPPCDIPSRCCFFTGPWTVTRSSLRMLRRVAAFCRPLRPVLLLVSFPRSRSPVVGVPGAVLDVEWCAVCASVAPSSWHIGGCAGCCRGRLTVFAVHAPLSAGLP